MALAAGGEGLEVRGSGTFRHVPGDVSVTRAPLIHAAVGPRTLFTRFCYTDILIK